ncbi:Serine proteinase stubble [Orchesella cincta]|uniref:Serine proteinase stubble n=1 Tax=Orchesella cincta TaxID=48709 RepID=A0A1D2MG43_ORCCI|nr:Serine proteinase stubble [Orchesella cincta]
MRFSSVLTLVGIFSLSHSWIVGGPRRNGAHELTSSYFFPRLFPQVFSGARSCPGGGCTLAILCWLTRTGCSNTYDEMQTSSTSYLSSQQALRKEETFDINDLSVSDYDIECGIQKMGAQKRIIGGNTASFGELPWQAHIRISGFQCGGVLLNHYYVATAAHCVHRAKLSDITIYLGEHDTKDTGRWLEPLPEERFAVVERIIHPRFKYMLTQPDRFDVALLRLHRPVRFKANILPICLPQDEKSYEGRVGVVAGWGKTDTSFGKTGTNVLQKVLVPVINNHECRRWHHQKHIRVELHDEMFCAGHRNGRMDACLGDSGGPLVVLDDGRWTLAGITSAGFGCAVDRQPGIYHKVSTTARWIRAQISA